MHECVKVAKKRKKERKYSKSNPQSSNPVQSNQRLQEKEPKYLHAANLVGPSHQPSSLEAPRASTMGARPQGA
jgi:hypothetical protein